MWSEKLWDYFVDMVGKGIKVPKETIYEKMIAQLWVCNAKTYVGQMENAGIDKGLVMGVDWALHPDIGEGPWSMEESNEWVAKEANEYPDKLLAICAIDPRRGKSAVELLDMAVNKWEMKGLKLHPTSGYYPDDPAYFPLYEKCLELNVPVYSHTAATIVAPLMSKYADPIYLDTVAAKFPDLKIVMLHCGSLSYSYKCAEIMGSRPNVYAELSGYQAQARLMPEHFLHTLRNILNMGALYGPPIREKVMFGTDWPMLEMALDQKAWVEWIQNIPEKATEFGLKFSRKEIKMILRKNAEKFLKS